MENTSNKNIFEAYFDGTIGTEERKEFEKRLENDLELQREFLQFGFTYTANSSSLSDGHSSILKDLRKSYDSLPTPGLSFWDKLWFQFGNWGIATLIGIPMILLAIYTGFVLTIKGDFDPKKYFVEAYCPGVAGGQAKPNLDEKYLEDFFHAGAIYCEIESGTYAEVERIVENCSGFCPATYYKAYWDLKSGSFDQAVAGFGECLNNEESLEKLQFYSPYESAKIKLNLIISKVGAGKSESEYLPGLVNLIQETERRDEMLEIYEKASELMADL